MTTQASEQTAQVTLAAELATTQDEKHRRFCKSAAEAVAASGYASVIVKQLPESEAAAQTVTSEAAHL